MKRTPAPDRQIESLTKWRNSELDRARVQHAQKTALAAQGKQAVDAAQSCVAGALGLMREQMAESGVICSEALTRLRHYTVVQLDVLKQAQTYLAAIHREVAHARAVMLQRFEAVAAVERLQQKRQSRA